MPKPSITGSASIQALGLKQLPNIELFIEASGRLPQTSVGPGSQPLEGVSGLGGSGVVKSILCARKVVISF